MKFRYFVLKEKGLTREYYRVHPSDEYDYWDECEWRSGNFITWTDKPKHRINGSTIEETSPLEILVLLGKEAVRMLYG